MKEGNILVITNWGYEEGLIQSYTLPYLKIIHQISPQRKIYLITQEKTGLYTQKEKLKKINEQLKESNIILLAEPYFRLGISKYISLFFWFLEHIRIVFFKRIEYIHTFCTPAGGYGYILSKVTGRKLIVDSYEPHSEYMREGGVWPEDGLAYKMVKFLEKKQAVRAKQVIATTPAMIEYSNNRFDINIKNSFIKPACVDLEKFEFDVSARSEIRKKLGIEDKIVAVYAGKFGGYYLKEEVFAFLKVAFRHWREGFHFLLLSDIDPNELKQLTEKYGLPAGAITLTKSPFDMMSKYLSAADFGIAAYRPAFSKQFCTPIKNGEYWAIGLPVVITKDISVDSVIIEENKIGYVLKELSDDEYEKAVKKIDELLKADQNCLREKIRQVAVSNRSYTIAENIYRKIY